MTTRLRIRVHYGRPLDLVILALALVVVILGAYLARDPAGVAASGAEASQAASTGLRHYYQTKTVHDGAGALGACAAGYHMASLWEILDPSNFRYNTELGLTTGDSGQGPTVWPGWVRTGTMADVGAQPGEGNCYGWTEADSGANGTQDFHVWHALTLPCDLLRPVWCLENGVSFSAYLPSIMRSYTPGREGP
jgi:hypothetical protein